MADAPKPDLRKGVTIAALPDGGMIAGAVDSDDALLVRSGDALYAVGASCTHYHGPLADGLVVGDTLRCPWHHACFSLRTGEALRAPAFDPIPCWRVERIGDVAYVREQLPASRAPATACTSVDSDASAVPASVVIVGGGAAGLAAADMLRREGYRNPVTILTADDAPPVDRPNLSKDFLAGTAPEDWLPLRPAEFYAERDIELVRGARAVSLDVVGKRVVLQDGTSRAFGALLIATGADPVHLDIPGAAAGQVHYLRSLADSRALIERTAGARAAVVVGASFIGLEAAASLRARGLDVHVVGPESVPLERVLGTEVGRFVRELHEEHGVVFHLGRTVASADGRNVILSDGTVLDADVIVVGVGVRPAVAMAQQAGLAIDRGVSVDAFLATSAPGVYAAGDVARWPDPHTGERLRIEHWVVAERQGQTAAKNILGRREPIDAVPFFWSQHYDVAINYVGHAEKWDDIAIDGSLAARDCAISYRSAGITLAVATIGRDIDSLRAERAMELLDSLAQSYRSDAQPIRRSRANTGEGAQGVGTRFAGKVALVAGGTGGLGRAVSQAFLDDGATVVVTYRRQEEFDVLAQAAGGAGTRLEGATVDVTDESAVVALVADVVAKHGRLDALVNAVGGYLGGTNLVDVDGTTLERMLALNLRSGYALARAAVPAMVERGSGAIVNIAAKSGLDHPAGAAAYAASKAAAIALMDSLAAELRGTGVRVNSVLPSTIDTPANRKAMPTADFATWPRPEDIANVILFLCSAEAKVIHGASIPVYGER